MADRTGVKIYNNVICPICRQVYYARGSGVQCGLYEATICMIHCEACKYLLKFMGGEWHCQYRQADDRDKQIAALYIKHGIQRKNAMPESTAFQRKK